jgi:hypothetical protein
MFNLTKIIANRDEFMKDTEEQFITKDKEYEIVGRESWGFAIIDDVGDTHWFEYGNCEYFDFHVKITE